MNRNAFPMLAAENERYAFLLLLENPINILPRQSFPSLDSADV